ncbi:hypothetical protein [Streptomyces radicis]|uniref:LPXTG cell wall anchor domain-containing protein n=1 Tax=Streptomyces radicis TaxID=1750517 RepID=A0A3A9WFD8_9ACTN|nr:hypothetical protein [Streptomyces radicis]RKN11499.1 hypothetical protein D7319_06055 [Streptomyces radicis]RKN26482.1 hypothetical protein D7318_03605 [Streptomyces radicis]
MKYLHRTATRLTAAAATSVLALGLAAPAALAADDAKSVSDQGTSPLTISPSSGGAGTTVTVKSSCQPAGPATSQAFQENITLRKDEDTRWVGTGRIKTSGLQVGRSYQVTVRCTDGVTLSTTFTFTAGTPSGGASAGFGGSGGANSGSTQATALAVGGGLAVAGAVGYVFLSRRRRSTGNHY